MFSCQFILEPNPDRTSPQKYILRYKDPKGFVSPPIKAFRTIGNRRFSLKPSETKPWFRLEDSGRNSLFGWHKTHSETIEPALRKTETLVSITFSNGKERAIFFDAAVDRKATSALPVDFGKAFCAPFRDRPEFGEDEAPEEASKESIRVHTPPSYRPN